MNSSLPRLSLLGSLAVIVGVALTLSSAQPTAGPLPAGHAAYATWPQIAAGQATIGAAHQRETVTYWTDTRMATAVPRYGLRREMDGDGAVLPAPEASSQAPPRRQSQSAPEATSDGRRWNGGGKLTKTTGKVFFTMDGRDFTCSAAVVASHNDDTVVTAGHCLKDGQGSWARNWLFVPGYDDGERPYGSYAAREMLVAPQWSEQGDDSYDFGVVVLDTDDGSHVADRTGAQRIAFNTANSERVWAFGYPATGRYAGRHLRYCAGPTTPDQSGTHSSGMACEMTQGSSGGPWLSDFDPQSGSGTVTSVISFKYANDTGTQYGPRLGDTARRLYQRAQRL
ncbi:trypsin-like serine peptidase [Salinactinospora qingdaonensis]|uniref:Peptidase n=1 Tax=Salinactinospora qingdaonensis TaxID=702744 RepID=A0ABP7GKB6_9ACTN